MTSSEPTPDGVEPEKPKVLVPTGDRDPVTGRFGEHIEADEEAAAHWDARRWERWS